VSDVTAERAGADCERPQGSPDARPSSGAARGDHQQGDCWLQATAYELASRSTGRRSCAGDLSSTNSLFFTTIHAAAVRCMCRSTMPMTAMSWREWTVTVTS
jgi:hypothetical protein